jgi:hypothetical protein
MEYLISLTPGPTEGFRVNPIRRQKLANGKRRMRRRLDKTDLHSCSKPMMTARTIHQDGDVWLAVP